MEAKHSELSLEEIIANYREEFGRQARGYVVHLFGAATGLTIFTSEIVKGLGSFELETLFLDTMEQAAYCFKNLFSSFRLGVFQSEEETVYIEEYLSFIDELRRTHPEMQQPKLLIADTIDFVSKQPALKSRVHLTRIFRLSCLCLDEPRFTFALVRFGSNKTDEPTSVMFDIVAPIQSYLSNVARGLDTLVSEGSTARFLALEKTFGGTGLSSTYCPWDEMDRFNRAAIQDCINSQSAGQRKVTMCASVDPQGSGKSPKKSRDIKSTKRQGRSASRGSSVERRSHSSGSPTKL